jgi:hypothetical protein
MIALLNPNYPFEANKEHGLKHFYNYIALHDINRHIFTNLSVKLHGVSFIDPSLNDTILSFIYNFWPTFKAFLYVDFSQFYDTKIATI